jgi:ankyrin repeat protein
LTNGKQNDLFLKASEAGCFQEVVQIVRNVLEPVDLNCRNECGDTPLILAARNGHDKLVQFLLREGADISTTNTSGDDALIAAAGQPGNAPTLEILISAGALINHRNAMGRTALIEASSIGDIRNVALLLQHGADIDTITDEDETALTFAVVNEFPDVVKALIEAGANVNWRDTKGWTAQTYAVNGGNLEIIRLLEIGKNRDNRK